MTEAVKLPPEQVAAEMNRRLGGFNRLIGLTFVSATMDELVTELVIGPDHTQPHGLVHGGVYCTMIETTCSAAGAMNVFAEGKTVVGMDNQTSFLRATREGTLRCTATPIHRGRRSQLWQGDIRRDDGKVVASGRMRVLVMDPGAKAAGETLAVRD